MKKRTIIIIIIFKFEITNYLLRHPRQFAPMPSRVLNKSVPHNGTILWCSNQGYIQGGLWCVVMENAHKKI